MDKTPGQELSDVFYGLQTTVKILEGIMIEYNEGKRDQSDYESRVHSQSNLLANNLKVVKPLVEKLFSEAYSKFKVSTKVLDAGGNEVEVYLDK